jgi:hypothetical protein
MLCGVTTASHAEIFEAYGIGLQSCAKFAKDYQQDPEAAETVYFSWAQGYLSGMNIVAKGVPGYTTRNLASVSTDRQKAWLRDYCSAHPLEKYSKAVAAMLGVLDVIPP